MGGLVPLVVLLAGPLVEAACGCATEHHVALCRHIIFRYLQEQPQEFRDGDTKFACERFSTLNARLAHALGISVVRHPGGVTSCREECDGLLV